MSRRLCGCGSGRRFAVFSLFFQRNDAARNRGEAGAGGRDAPVPRRKPGSKSHTLGARDFWIRAVAGKLTNHPELLRHYPCTPDEAPGRVSLYFRCSFSKATLHETGAKPVREFETVPFPGEIRAPGVTRAECATPGSRPPPGNGQITPNFCAIAPSRQTGASEAPGRVPLLEWTAPNGIKMCQSESL